VEIVAYRVFWSLVFLAVVATAMRRWRTIGATLNRRTLAWLSGAALLLALNWSVYVYAITSNQVVEASLGYFINPLVTVLLAVVVLHERLPVIQWLAVGLAGVGVVIITVSVGAAPWVGLALAFTFGTYGLIRKHVSLGALEGLTIESGVLFPVAALFLVVTGAGLHGTGSSTGIGMVFLLALAGPITAIPLLGFGAAAQRLPLATLGLLQYICPTIVFILGLTVFDEPMTLGEWIGFGCIWAALIALTWSMLRHPARSRREFENEVASAEAS
jgi:chloramphenicol-sensitive protein RarD